MDTDKGMVGCFLTVIMLGLLLAGVFFVIERGQSWATERERTQAQIERERTAQLEARLDHKETMFMLYTTSLAAYTQSFGLLDIVGLLTIGTLAILGGFALGKAWGWTIYKE